MPGIGGVLVAMSSDTDETSPMVPVVCPDCETMTRVPLARVPASVKRHNDLIHDGEAVAVVDPDVADHLADIVAEELGLL